MDKLNMSLDEIIKADKRSNRGSATNRRPSRGRSRGAGNRGSRRGTSRGGASGGFSVRNNVAPIRGGGGVTKRSRGLTRSGPVRGARLQRANRGSRRSRGGGVVSTHNATSLAAAQSLARAKKLQLNRAGTRGGARGSARGGARTGSTLRGGVSKAKQANYNAPNSQATVSNFRVRVSNDRYDTSGNDRRSLERTYLMQARALIQAQKEAAAADAAASAAAAATANAFRGVLVSGGGGSGPSRRGGSVSYRGGGRGGRGGRRQGGRGGGRRGGYGDYR